MENGVIAGLSGYRCKSDSMMVLITMLIRVKWLLKLLAQAFRRGNVKAGTVFWSQS